MPAAILGTLRAATAPDHLRLETSLGLLDPSLDLLRYRWILERFFGFWAGWQPLVAARLADPAFTAPRDRRPLLATDLAWLGLTQAALGTLATCQPPRLEDAAAALGSLYVLEGSTLGGRQILKTVAPRLGLGETAGAAYFAGYGAETGPMWRAFLGRLETSPDPEATIDGATRTFDTLIDWLG